MSTVTITTAQAVKTVAKTADKAAAKNTAELDAAEAPKPAAAAPSVHRRAVLTWLAVYPTITAVQFLLGKSVATYPLPVRTLIVTLLVAPLVVYLVLPSVMKAHNAAVRRNGSRRSSK